MDMSSSDESTQWDDRVAIEYLDRLKPKRGPLADATSREAAKHLKIICDDVEVASTIAGQENAINLLVTLARDCLESEDYRLLTPILSVIANLLRHKRSYGMLPEEESVVEAVMTCIYEGEDDDCVAEAFKAMTVALRRPGEEHWWSTLQADSRFAHRVLRILKESNSLNLLQW